MNGVGYLRKRIAHATERTVSLLARKIVATESRKSHWRSMEIERGSIKAASIAFFEE